MNIFRVVMLDTILLLFSLVIYILFLATNRSINKDSKKILFSFALVSSMFLTYRYSNQILLINLILMNSLILIGYIKKYYFTANLIALLIILVYTSHYHLLIFMIIPYIFLIILTYIKKKAKISDFIFIDIFLFVYYFCMIIWLSLFNNDYLKTMPMVELVLILVLNYIIIHIIYFIYNEGENIIKTHLIYKELQREKQIRLSLFKITHEIKNPIAVIKAYLDMLDVNNKKQVHKYIPIIKGEIDRLLILLQDFMLVNKDNVDIDIMDINMLIEEVVDTMNPLLKKNNINLNTNIIDDEIFIGGDYKRISQVLINILKNSIESMDKEIKQIDITESIEKECLTISVKDNGCGISKDNLKHLKTPFYTTKQKGTGLGVSLSNEIIKAHNGFLNYSSDEGQGTNVTIVLPLNKERMV